MPSANTPPQKITFSPALKRPDGGSSPPNRPPPLRSQFQSARSGELSRTKVKNTTASDTANSGPAKLCAVFSA